MKLNKFKIGLFAFNASSGVTVTTSKNQEIPESRNPKIQKSKSKIKNPEIQKSKIQKSKNPNPKKQN